MKIIITGMHRSGTSMIAGVLQICGLYLGSNLLGPMKSNAKGHFEDRGFLQINEEILKANGGRWNKPPRLVSMPGEAYLKKMRAFIAGFPRTRPVGWKDPRACLTLEVWKQAIEPEELKVILVSRPVDEIAASLKKRNGMGYATAETLHFQYQKAAIQALDRNKIKWQPAYYPEIMTHGKKALKPILKFIGLEFEPEDRLTAEILDFIDPDLWHHKSNKGQL